MSQTPEAIPTVEEAAAEELSVLKARAKTLGISHSPNIGLGALREKVNAQISSGEKEPQVEIVKDTEEPADPVELTPLEQRAAIRKKLHDEEKRLVRIRITCMNPAKKEWNGEFFTVANKYLGTVRKFVPFGEATDNGYHVEHCIYRMLKDKKFQSIKTKPDPKNKAQIEVIRRWVPEFAIEVLEPLTKDELAHLASQQAAAKGLA